MMAYIEKVVAGAKKLVPPTSDATDTQVQRWRWSIALVSLLNAFGLSVHIALACGFASPFYPGFAQAADVKGVRDEMKAVKEELRVKRANELGGLILDAKQKQCAASGEAKRLYLQSYNNLRAEYYALLGREHSDPPCSDFRE